MKHGIEQFRSFMTGAFKSFEKFAVSVYKKVDKKLTQLYGNSKKNKSIFAAVFSVVFVLIVTIFTTAVSNFSVEVDTNTVSGEVVSVESSFSDLNEVESDDSGVETVIEEVSSAEQTTTTVPQVLTKISAVKSSYSVNIGKSVKVGVVYTPDTAANKAINWSSSNTTVATVDSAGNVKGISEGSCKIQGVSAENSAIALVVTVNVKKPEEAKSEKYSIKVFIGSQSVVVYSKDSKGEYTVPVRTMACSTGTSGHDTPVTSFKILRKYRWKELMGPTWEQYCCSLSNSYLFHSIPYNKKNDPSSISTGAYNALGRKASHGCVRLACIDAKWIYDNCAIGTKVQIVSGSGPKGSKVPMNSDSYYAGWDPTDPDPNNPYNKRPPSKTTTTTKKTTTPATTTKKTTATQKPTTKPTTTMPSTTEKTTTNRTTTVKTTTTRRTTTTTTTTAPESDTVE